MVSGQAFVEVSTIVILILSAALAVLLTAKFLKKRQRSHLYWSIGLWLFAVDVLLEVAFAYGVYSELLIGVYLFTVALLVEFLALGSVQLVKSKRLRLSYYAFCVASTALLAYSIAVSHIGNIITNYIVFGALPLLVTVMSIVVTFPAAAVLVAVAAVSYKRRRSKKMLSIIAGVVVVTVAGTLYIAAFPVFLYYSEFIGILLLWLGFL